MRPIKIIFLLILSTNLVLSQTQSDETVEINNTIKTSNFKFENANSALAENNATEVSTVKHESMQSFDLSFLKDYTVKTYNMGDYYFDSRLMCMPFREWGPYVIPYHLKQETFTIVKKKK